MSARGRAELWQRLVDAGLAHGDLPAAGEPPAPWYVRAMLGIAGWIGAMFLLFFVGVGLQIVIENEGAAIAVGALCCAAAGFIFAKAGRNVLAAQFGLAVSLAGQAMFIYGLAEGGGFGRNSGAFLLIVAAFECALAYFMANYVHRVLSALAAATAFSFALQRMGLYLIGDAATGAAVAAIWLDHSKWAARGALWRAIGWGFVLAYVRPAGLLYQMGVGSSTPPLMPIAWLPFISLIFTAGVLLYVVYRLLEQYGEPPNGQAGIAALGAAAALCAVAYKASGIPESVVILLLGFATGSRALFGVGILALLSYISYFYYSLEATLLVKSFALAGTGVVMLGLRALMPVVLSPGRERAATDA